MVEIRHLENPEIAISQRKIIRFWWNLVYNSRFPGSKVRHLGLYFLCNSGRSMLQTRLKHCVNVVVVVLITSCW